MSRELRQAAQDYLNTHCAGKERKEAPNKDPFEKLLGEVARFCYIRFRAAGLQDYDAQDQASEVVAKLIVELKDKQNCFKGHVLVMLKWLNTVVSNQIRRWYKRRKRGLSLFSDLKAVLRADKEQVNVEESFSNMEGEDALDVVIKDQKHKAHLDSLYWALEKLDPTTREVLILHYVEGLSYQQVARVVGSTAAAVRKRASRGVAKLKELVKIQQVKPRSPKGKVTNNL